MQLQHFTYPGTADADGVSPVIHGDLYMPDPGREIRAVVQFVHGMDEHFGRYRELARALCAEGIVLAGEDHRGHGRSVPEGGVFGSFSAAGSGWTLVLSDLCRLRGMLRRRFPGVPFFLLGHSMGSFLVRSMLLRGEEPPADGVILSGTAYHEAAMLEAGRELCRAVIAKSGRETPMTAVMDASGVLYNLRFHPVKTEYDWVSGDPETVQAHIDDPYCGHTPTAGLFDDMIGGLLAVCAGNVLSSSPKRKKEEPHIPVLFISGAKDPVGDYGVGVKKTAAVFRYQGYRDVTVLLYPEARHEVLLDRCREITIQDVLAWITGHLTKASGTDSSI